MYWEPAKYVAKLRTLKTDARPLLFKINLDAGHGGASGRYDHLREIAFDYAFVLTQLGLAARYPSQPRVLTRRHVSDSSSGVPEAICLGEPRRLPWSSGDTARAQPEPRAPQRRKRAGLERARWSAGRCLALEHGRVDPCRSALGSRKPLRRIARSSRIRGAGHDAAEAVTAPTRPRRAPAAGPDRPRRRHSPSISPGIRKSISTRSGATSGLSLGRVATWGINAARGRGTVHRGTSATDTASRPISIGRGPRHRVATV